jgi:phage baseplate assembly protein W
MAVFKTYIGFSTQGSERSRNWTLYDVELVKRDLLNHFYTRVGERVMRPTFGCRIWDFLMEPLNDANRDSVIEEATRVVRSDPRVDLVALDVTEYEHGLRLDVTVNYIGLNVIDTFIVNFEGRETARLEGQLDF